ncbi:hypothetical protein RBH89_06955 [Paracidovorax avenae]
MKHFAIAASIAVAALASLPAEARTPVPVINLPHIAIPASASQGRTDAQVRQAITMAAQAKGWTVAAPEAGKLVATLNVRGKHTVMVDIPYDSKSYSLLYRDSANMKYSQLNGEAVIHPNYNRWTQDLRTAIDQELLRTAPL